MPYPEAATKICEAVYQFNVQNALEWHFRCKAAGTVDRCQLCSELAGDHGTDAGAVPRVTHLIRHPDCMRDSITAALVVPVCAECADSWSQLVIVEL